MLAVLLTLAPLLAAPSAAQAPDPALDPLLARLAETVRPARYRLVCETWRRETGFGMVVPPLAFEAEWRTLLSDVERPAAAIREDALVLLASMKGKLDPKSGPAGSVWVHSRVEREVVHAPPYLKQTIHTDRGDDIQVLGPSACILVDGPNHQITVTDPSGGVMPMWPAQLLGPLGVSEASRKWLRTRPWKGRASLAGTPAAEAPCWIQTEDDTRIVRIDICWNQAAARPEACLERIAGIESTLALFTWDATQARELPLGLPARIVRIEVGQRHVEIQHWSVTGYSNEISASALDLALEGDLILFDTRGSKRGEYGSDRSTWPAALRSLLEFAKPTAPELEKR